MPYIPNVIRFILLCKSSGITIIIMESELPPLRPEKACQLHQQGSQREEHMATNPAESASGPQPASYSALRLSLASLPLSLRDYHKLREEVDKLQQLTSDIRSFVEGHIKLKAEAEELSQLVNGIYPLIKEHIELRTELDKLQGLVRDMKLDLKRCTPVSYPLFSRQSTVANLDDRLILSRKKKNRLRIRTVRAQYPSALGRP